MMEPVIFWTKIHHFVIKKSPKQHDMRLKIVKKIWWWMKIELVGENAVQGN